jgi:hypothetical protein
MSSLLESIGTYSTEEIVSTISEPAYEPWNSKIYIFTNLPQSAFTAADVVALYLHRGAYAPTLADEDQEQDPDRWCSYTECGQELWQVAWKSGVEPATDTGKDDAGS